MGLLGYSLCLFFTLTLLSSVVFIFLILSNILKHPHLRLDKNQLENGVSLINNKLINDDFYSYLKKYPINVSDQFLEFFHKNSLIVRLRRSEYEVSKYLMSRKDYKNLYDVRFRDKKSSIVPNIQMLCDIPASVFVKFQTEPEFSFIAQDLNEIFGIQDKSESRQNMNCAIVSNSGSLIGSKLGEEIDSHDIVMRFNNAPAFPYKEDVGTKTSIRLINSQLLLNDKFNISSSHLYRNRVKFVWDASDYSLDYNKWFKKSHKFFESFKNVLKLFPNETFAILDPKLIWKSWDLLQSTTRINIPKNPPTSGFLGIIVLLKFCSKLDIYEYIPSIRMTEKCHYYDNTIDRGCTFGQW